MGVLPDQPDLWVVLDKVVQVLPCDQGEHDAMGGSLTVLTLPDGSEVAYTEGADYGQLVEDPAEVRRYTVTYDRLRAVALTRSCRST